VEEFGASGLAWRRIVEGIIVEKLWKHLANAAPGVCTQILLTFCLNVFLLRFLRRRSWPKR
jgi:hypothetical protein